MLDDQVDEIDLVRGQGAAGEKAGEGGSGGGAVEADQGADEEAQALGVGFGAVDLLGTAPLSRSMGSRSSRSVWVSW